MKSNEYIIVQSSILDTLERNVNLAMKEGWICQGGLVVIPKVNCGVGRQFGQAMTRKKPSGCFYIPPSLFNPMNPA